MTEPVPLVSITIPTYREEEYIVKTIQKLTEQTMWPQSEVVLGDYDADGKGVTRKAILNAFDNDILSRISVVDVKRKGIGIARRLAVQHSRGPFIVTMDADSEFNRVDAMELLVGPLVRGEAMVTHCNNLLPEKENPPAYPAFLYALRCVANEKFFPFVYEPGLTFSRVVYDSVGGWRDVTWLEGPLFGTDVYWAYGEGAFMFVNEVTVFVSSRRVDKSLLWFADYDHAYRKSGVVEVK